MSRLRAALGVDVCVPNTYCIGAPFPYIVRFRVQGWWGLLALTRLCGLTFSEIR